MQGGKLSSGRRNIRNAECQVCHYHHVYEQSNAHGAHGPNYNEEIPNHSQTRIVWDFEQGGSKSTWVEGLLSFCPSLIIQLADSLVRLLPSLSHQCCKLWSSSTKDSGTLIHGGFAVSPCTSTAVVHREENDNLCVVAGYLLLLLNTWYQLFFLSSVHLININFSTFSN